MARKRLARCGTILRMKAQPLNVLTRFLCATLICVSSYNTFPACAADNASPPERTLPATAQTAVKAAILNHPRLILKNGAHFVVLDEAGLMPAGTSYGYGLYKDDTRYLSSLDFSLNGANPVLLSASTEEGYAGRFIYGNAADAASGTPEQQIMLQRDIVIRDGVSEKITLTNFGNQPVILSLAIAYSNDFADMFEVRGIGRKRRGQLQSVEQSLPNGSLISYIGLDNKLMTTRLLFSETPAKRQGDRVEFQYKLNGQQSKTIEMNISTAGLDETFAPNPTIVSYDAGKLQADKAYSDWRKSTASVTTSNTEFNKLLERSIRDIYILRQPTPRGNCLAALPGSR